MPPGVWTGVTVMPVLAPSCEFFHKPGQKTTSTDCRGEAKVCCDPSERGCAVKKGASFGRGISTHCEWPFHVLHDAAIHPAPHRLRGVVFDQFPITKFA